jgi:hypothetical protein
MTDDTPPEITTSQNGSATPVVAMDALATLIHSFGSMMVGMETRQTSQMDKMEARLTEKIRDNAHAAETRWTRWEADSKAYREAMDGRVRELETWRQEHMEKVRAWQQQEHDEEIRSDARVRPVLTAVQYVSHNWRTILLIIVSILAVLGFAGDNIHTFMQALGIGN